jgi:pimeloyl-ACP methyl ester carboxylesterase
MPIERLNRVLSPFRSTLTRRSALVHGAGAALSVAGTLSVGRAAFATSQTGTPVTESSPVASPVANTATAPTVVLVHGSFADASGWAQVITKLRGEGVATIAPATLQRSISGDAAYLASVVEQIPGPVLLVGHSYGGAVITNAGSLASNVIGLVYVCGFIPDEGEVLLDIVTASTDSLIGPALKPQNYPTADPAKPGAEFYIDEASFHTVFCADLPEDLAAVMAVSQRPIADISFGEPTKNPAWKTIPSWAVVGKQDKTIGYLSTSMMAKRAGATTVEIDSSHVAMISNPKAVSDLILAALGTLS